MRRSRIIFTIVTETVVRTTNNLHVKGVYNTMKLKNEFVTPNIENERMMHKNNVFFFLNCAIFIFISV